MDHNPRCSDVSCILVVRGHLAVFPAAMVWNVGEHKPCASRAHSVGSTAIGKMLVRVGVAVRCARGQHGTMARINHGIHVGVARVVGPRCCRPGETRRTGRAPCDSGCILERYCWIRVVHRPLRDKPGIWGSGDCCLPGDEAERWIVSQTPLSSAWA